MYRECECSRHCAREERIRRSRKREGKRHEERRTNVSEKDVARRWKQNGENVRHAHKVEVKRRGKIKFRKVSDSLPSLYAPVEKQSIERTKSGTNRGEKRGEEKRGWCDGIPFGSISCEKYFARKSAQQKSQRGLSAILRGSSNNAERKIMACDEAMRENGGNWKLDLADIDNEQSTWQEDIDVI